MELLDITNNFTTTTTNTTTTIKVKKQVSYSIDEEVDDEYDTYKNDFCLNSNDLEFDNWDRLSITNEQQQSTTTQATTTTETETIIYSITSDDDKILYEISNVVKSTNDNRILNDERLIKNLNNLQIFQSSQTATTTTSSYFDTIQNDIKAYMRKIVIGWMLEVCEEEKCDKLVFPLAVYILDKFLFEHRITRNIFQLVACVCLFLSSKIFNVIPISAERLVLFSDNSITIDNIIDMEIIILNELKWDLIFITPIEYIEYLLNKLTIRLKESKKTHIDVKKIASHCKTLIYLCLIESECLSTLPSIISSACLLAAFYGIYKKTDANIICDLIVNEAKLNLTDVIKYKEYVEGLYAASINDI